jgi:hypothetical protein
MVQGSHAHTPDDDRRTLGFVDDSERRFVGQEAQRRSIEQTLDLASELLERFPTNELKRIPAEIVARYRACPGLQSSRVRVREEPHHGREHGRCDCEVDRHDRNQDPPVPYRAGEDDEGDDQEGRRGEDEQQRDSVIRQRRRPALRNPGIVRFVALLET